MASAAGRGCLARAEPPHAARDQPGLKELACCRVRGVAIHSKRESQTGRGGKEHHSPVRLRNALGYAGGDKVVGVALKSRAVYGSESLFVGQAKSVFSKTGFACPAAVPIPALSLRTINGRG